MNRGRESSGDSINEDPFSEFPIDDTEPPSRLPPDDEAMFPGKRGRKKIEIAWTRVLAIH